MNREILRLAIPNILSNLSIPLLSTVDTALMGRMSDVHIGAVGVGSMIFNFVYWNFGFLRMGTTGITAQFFGAGDRSGAINTLARAVLLAIGIGLLMLILQIPLREGGVVLMQSDGELSSRIREYFDIRIWAAPATLLSYAIFGWFFGMQNAVFPLIITVLVNVVNIVVSYFLVFRYGMDIEGVALGTVIAQYFGLGIGMALILYRYKEYFPGLQRDAVLQLDAFRRFLRVNRDIFIRTVCLTLAFGFFYSQSSSFGAELLAVNVILLQYVNWLSYAVDGFAFATESIVGKYFGAGLPVQVRKAIRLNFLWALGLAVGFAGVYLVAGEELLRVFTNQEGVIADALPYLPWMAVIPVAGFACYIWDGVFVGLTASAAMRDTMIIAFVVFLGSFFLVFSDYGNHGLWMCLALFLASRGLVQWLWYRKYGLDLAS